MSKKTKIITTIVGLLAIATTALILVLDSAFEGKAWQKVPPEKHRHSKVNSHYLPIEEEFNDLETVTVSTIGEWQDKKTLLVETQILGLPLYEEWEFRFDDENRLNWNNAFQPGGSEFSLKCTLK